MAATAIIVHASYVNGCLQAGYESVAFTGDATEYLDGTGAFSTPSGGTATPAALTRTDDTNVTLTLGGTPATALLQATSITVGWSGQLSVARGGTGLSTLTAHSLYVGNGTSAPTALGVATNGQIPIGSTGADPVLAALTAGYGITVTNGAGSITLTNTFGGLIILRDNQTSGTSSGTFTSGAWRTRTLNAEATDTGNNCSLASNQFTLDAGTYEIIARAPAFEVDNHQIKLANITDGTDEIIGTNAYSAPTDAITTDSWVVGRFTIASAKAFEIQHRCATTKATEGFGTTVSWGTATFTTVILRKVA